jgi:hypothetical protein
MLTAYRELNNGRVDTIELDVHLEQCASCRQFLVRSTFVGKALRDLPEIEPPPEMRAQLMHRLASEHLQFMQKAPAGSVTTPAFLKPYLQEHAQSTQAAHSISALTTADTGPLPVLRAGRNGRPRTHHAPMSRFAILGLAAAFLMILMMGGITSLVYLAQHDAQQISHLASRNVDTIHHIDISELQYITPTLYPHIASAVADSSDIYYTAYSDGTSPQWMLLQMSRDKQASTPLLSKPSEEPMVVLGSSPDWLIWLQYGTSQAKLPRTSIAARNSDIITPWSLYALSLTQVHTSQQPASTLSTLPTPQLLLKGNFNPAAVPSWVHTPVQGSWLMQDMLLVTALDTHGNSHLYSSQLNLDGKSPVITLATAEQGHIFTSPTANSTSTQIYWADEWISGDGNLSSDIWQLLQVNASGVLRPTHGRWYAAAPATSEKQLFLADGLSFHPQVAGDALFWIHMPAQPSTTGTPAPAPTQNSPTIIPRMDAAFYAPPLDATVAGQLMMLPIDSDTLAPPTPLTTTGLAYSLQVGADFALWQTDKGYQMYDVQTQSDVTVGNDLTQASFLAVNDNTAVWIKDIASTGTAANKGMPPTVQFFAFDWPK